VHSRLLAGASEPPAGRFNAGQKVNFVLVCILLAVLYITGGDTTIAGTHQNLIFGAHKLATIGICILPVDTLPSR
jgi:cytochrome b subunit of formate dehydrogenase